MTDTTPHVAIVIVNSVLTCDSRSSVTHSLLASATADTTQKHDTVTGGMLLGGGRVSLVLLRCA